MNIGISAEHRAAISAELNGILSDLVVMQIKSRKYHWNVTGPHFTQLHAFFGSLYEGLDAQVDEVAERIRSLGHTPHGSMKAFLADTRQTEDERSVVAWTEMLSILCSDTEALVCRLRTAIGLCTDDWGDDGTADFLTGLMEAHEKNAWMIRSHLG